MSRVPSRRPPDEPSNRELMTELEKINDRLDRGDQWFEEMKQLRSDAKTLAQVAEGYRLANLGGRLLLWAVSVLAAVGAWWKLVMHGEWPKP